MVGVRKDCVEDFRLCEGLIGVNVMLWGLVGVKEKLEGRRLRCRVSGEYGIMEARRPRGK